MYSLTIFFQHHLPKSWFFIFQPTRTPLSLPSSHRGLSLCGWSNSVQPLVYRLLVCAPALELILVCFGENSLNLLPFLMCIMPLMPYYINIQILETVCPTPQFTLSGGSYGYFYNDCMSRNFAKPVFDPLNYFRSVNYFVLIIIPSVKFLSFLFIICAFLLLTFLLTQLSCLTIKHYGCYWLIG